MLWRGPSLCILLLLASSVAVPDGALGSGRNPGSCLLYPYYDAGPGAITLFTVTDLGELPSDPVHLCLAWISGQDCTPSYEWKAFRENDTLTWLAGAGDGRGGQGFLYVYAVEGEGSFIERKANVFIGRTVIFRTLGASGAVHLSFNAVPFQARSLTPDGKLRLDGMEYEQAPARVLFPRHGGLESPSPSQVILINLTGGRFFENRSLITVYSAGEDCFSHDLVFPCFWTGPLAEAHPAADASFLRAACRDPEGGGGADPSGKPLELGWIGILGLEARHGNRTFPDPGIYSLLIGQGEEEVEADLPMTIHGPSSRMAMLWSTSPDGT